MEPFELRFWFEHGGTCLWSKNEAARARYGYAVNNLALPITRALQDELRELEERYHGSLDWACPSNPSPWSADDWADFRADAVTAYWRLVHALGSSYRVVNDIDACIYGEQSAPQNTDHAKNYCLQNKDETKAIRIENICISDEDYRAGSPYNTTLNVTVQSDPFAGESVFEIDIADFCAFTRELNDLYNNLRGKALLSDIGNGSSVEFEVINRLGHIEARGQLFGYNMSHSMTFAFRVDQTDLQAFAQNLHADFGLPEKYRR